MTNSDADFEKRIMGTRAKWLIASEDLNIAVEGKKS